MREPDGSFIKSKKMINNLYCLFAALFLFAGCVTDNSKEDKNMEEKNIASRLKEIQITENDKLDNLSKEISASSRKDVFELIKILHGSNKEESQKASMILMSIGDLSISPIVDSVDTANPDNYVNEMDISLSLHLQNRSKMSKHINSMLLDKRELKGPQLKGVVEEKPPTRRVCDEAYLMLRKLFAFKEDEESLMTNERLFLSLSNKERDEEIDRIKSTEEWVSLSEKMMSEGEF